VDGLDTEPAAHNSYAHIWTGTRRAITGPGVSIAIVDYTGGIPAIVPLQGDREDRPTIPRSGPPGPCMVEAGPAPALENLSWKNGLI
jgi:hypothetical protein